MDVFSNAEQIGLIDYQGVPRPAWWAFKWFGELPVERKVATSLDVHQDACGKLGIILQAFSLANRLLWVLHCNDRWPDGLPCVEEVRMCNLQKIVRSIYIRANWHCRRFLPVQQSLCIWN